MSNKDVSIYDEHEEWQLSYSTRSNNQAELTGGSLQSSEVAHSLMLEISAVSPHIKVASL